MSVTMLCGGIVNDRYPFLKCGFRNETRYYIDAAVPHAGADSMTRPVPPKHCCLHHQLPTQRVYLSGRLFRALFMLRTQPAS